MQTLIINGSPRRAGGTAALVAALRETLPGETSVVETYYAGISPCIDCRYCWTKPGCAIEDGMQEIYRKIDVADAIVIASPIHFAQLTGSLLQWASRLQMLWTAKAFRKTPYLADKPRRGGVLLVDGGDGAHEEALAMGKRLLRIMGAPYVGHVYFSGTDRVEPTHPGEHVLEEVRRLAVGLAEK